MRNSFELPFLSKIIFYRRFCVILRNITGNLSLTQFGTMFVSHSGFRGLGRGKNISNFGVEISILRLYETNSCFLAPTGIGDTDIPYTQAILDIYLKKYPGVSTYPFH